jgi:hypothetical protein
MRKTAWACAVAASLLAGGCKSVPFLGGDPDAVTVEAADYTESRTPIPDADLDALWERAQQVVSGEGLAVDDSRTRYAERRIVTRWNTILSPQRFEGRRSRVWIGFRQQGGGWIASVAVQVQRNSDIDNPSDPARCNWEVQPNDAARAGVILWKIESGFRPIANETR